MYVSYVYDIILIYIYIYIYIYISDIYMLTMQSQEILNLTNYLTVIPQKMKEEYFLIFPWLSKKPGMKN